MKKIILGMVFVFTSVAMVNANTETTELIAYEDCFADAWRYGTENGGGNEFFEWLFMDVYYEQFC